jgi:signal transduction histidine kinase
MSSKERVLVVDDSPQNQTVAKGYLEAAGFEVIAVSSGEEALEVLLKERVDLVVLDVLMPGLGGFETCRRIRATPSMADMPVLFLTALGDREATAPAIEAGGDDLLPKPFHRAELLLRTRALIRQRQTTAELKQALRALAEQNEALRRMEHDKRKISQLIIHDLRNPVSAVLANGELLQQKLTGEEGEMISDIMIAAQQLDRTARDLVDLSRAEEGTFTAKLESFSLSELAAEVVSTMRGMARWTNVQFDLDIGRERVVADRELTRRLLQNLVHNAVKHAPENTAVRIEAGVDTDGLVVRVIDKGPGVPRDELESIFDRFRTLQDDPARSGSHGLGLAFCRMAAEAQGGRIWVEDREGHGASFCVRIPQPAS